MLEIWGRKNSINVQKVMWTIGELGLEHQRHDAGMSFGVVDTDDYAKLNPNRKVPTLKDGDLILWESNAIVRYLAARHGDAAFWPREPGARALLDRWMDWTSLVPMGDVITIFWGLIRTKEADRDMAAIERAQEKAAKALLILEAELAGRKFLGGDAFSFGDIVPGVLIYRYQALPIERPVLPNITMWYERLQEREAFREHVMLPLT